MSETPKLEDCFYIEGRMHGHYTRYMSMVTGVSTESAKAVFCDQLRRCHAGVGHAVVDRIMPASEAVERKLIEVIDMDDEMGLDFLAGPLFDESLTGI